MKKSEIRKDYLMDKYVIIAPRRSKLPKQIKETSVVVSPISPFTSDHLKKAKIIDSIGRGKDQIIVLKNLFPAVALNNKKAYGTQEVIIEVPDPSIRLSDLPIEHFVRLLTMYSRRIKALMALPKIDYILCFKNEGASAGASIQHEHSQIFASNFLPPEAVEEFRLLEEYHKKNRSHFYGDLIKKEIKTSRRVYEDQHIVAFTPYASAFHYEVWVFTKRQVDNLTKLSKSEVLALAKVLKMILEKLKKLGLAYNYTCRQSVSNKHQHFCIKIEPRDSVWAGVELDAGLIINSVPPEDAAKYYRKK
jgi:UDPglucose--hexose-1-phosphate uridylyltransferase